MSRSPLLTPRQGSAPKGKPPQNRPVAVFRALASGLLGAVLLGGCLLPQDAPDGLVVLGIDEDTVILAAGGLTRVLGRGTVTVWRDRQPTRLVAGDQVPPNLVKLP